MQVYLDSAASSQLHPDVLKEMIPFFSENYGNPSSSHSFGRKAKAALEQARKAIAQSINASPLEIIFTSCGTESNNMALKSAVQTYNIEHIITSPVEHKCVFNTCIDIAAKTSTKLHYLKVDAKGNIDLQHLDELLSTLNGKKLVTLIHANNEIGTIIDLQKAGEICKQYEALFHADTVQTICHYPIDVQAININFLSGSAHKFHGPKGIGFLYVKKDSKINTYIHGGGQERGYRSGTENVAGIVGMAKALEIANENLERDKQKITELRSYFAQQLTQKIEDIKFNGDFENGLYTVLSVSFPTVFKSDMLLFSLDLAGIAASGGSACSSGASTGSHVLDAIGHAKDRKTIRFSFSHFNTKEEIDYTVEQILKLK
jgi:cysteine desulfurase